MSNRRHYLWAFVERVAPLAISFVVSILVARIVGPEAYGLVAMLGLFMALGQAFTELGFGAALVQRQELTADDETSVFYVNLVAGAIVTGLLCLASPLVARLFGQPVLVPLMCAQSVGVVFASAGIVQYSLIWRRMQFRLAATVELVATALSGAVGLAMAYGGAGVWSLVGLGLTREAARAAGAWIVSDWRPRGTFSWPRVVRLWDYCSRLAFSSLLHQSAANLHTVFIGRLFPPEALGLYSRAAGFQALPIGVITGMVQRVTFPLFSRHQDDREMLLRMLRRQVRLLSLLVSMIMGLLAALAADFVPWLLGPKWVDSVKFLQIFCLGGVLAAVFPLHSNMTMALGESRAYFRMELAKKACIVGTLSVASQFGVVAFAWAAVAIALTDYWLSSNPSARLIGYSRTMQARDLLPPQFVAAASALVVLFVPWPASWLPLGVMVVKSMLFLACAATAVLCLRLRYFPDAWQIVREGLVASHAWLPGRS